MSDYLKRLNWKGTGIIFFVSLFGAISRKQDDSILHSLVIGLTFGIPFALIFLFIGVKPKRKQEKVNTSLYSNDCEKGLAWINCPLNLEQGNCKGCEFNKTKK